MLDFSLHWEELRKWWVTPVGQALLETESKEVERVITTLFGYHLLLLGEGVFMELLVKSPIMHRVWMHPKVNVLEGGGALGSRHDKLPIAGDSVDVVYLAHCLEFINNPHEVLRETFRVLIPEGYVIISGFNPWSLWGAWRCVMRFIRHVPWDSRFVSVGRLKDWLALLGFDVVQISPYFFRPPFSHARFLQYLKWLEKVGSYCWPFLGGAYLVLARKRIITLTPIKPSFQTKSKLAVQGVVGSVQSSRMEAYGINMNLSEEFRQ